MKNLLHPILFFSLSLLVLAGCKNKDSSSPGNDGISDMNAREFFSAYTQGMILDNDHIEFRFLEAQDIDSVQLRKAISLSPKFDYTLQYEKGNTSFKIIPDQKLKRGETYEVELSLQKIFKNPRSKSFVSKLKVFEQFVSVQREGLIIDEGNQSHIQLYVTTALDEDQEKIKKLFDYPETRIQIETISGKEFILKLEFTPAEGTTKLLWSGSSIGSEEKGFINVWNYNKDDFTVVNTYFDRTANEYNVYFTKLLDEDQDAKGLIRIGDKDAEYQIFNNQIKALIRSNTDENIKLSISKGIRSKDGQELALDLTYEIEVSIVKPDLQWLADGSYIPVSGQFRIPFKAKALQSVVVRVVGIKSENASRYAAWNSMNYMDQTEMIRFGNLVYKSSYNLAEHTSNKLEEWNEFGIDITDAFQREKGTIYYIQLSYGPSNTILSCEDSSIYEFEKETVEPDWFENRYRHYQYYHYYDYSQQENPCHISYYLARSNIAKLIHCTNVFPVIKKGEKEIHIAVKELLNQNIAKGAKIDLISLQGLKISSSEVANNGICVFRNLDREPKAIRVSYEGEISYFNMEDGEENQLTEFDVSSDVKDIDNRIFVYTDRDVRRPGDTIYMDIMLNRSKFQFEEDLPIVVRLKNPKNVLYKKSIIPIKNGKSIYTFKMPTQLDSPTGYWKADIQIGPLQKIKTLRVESIKPNVVDLIYHFDNQEDSWIYSNKISGKLDVNYLAGYAMRDGKVTASANILPISTPFSDYKNYTFHPSERPDHVKDIKAWSVITDQKGKAFIHFTQDFKQFLGVSKVVIDSKMDLPGGGLNTETESRLISPYNSYVGIEKTKGKGWRGSYRVGETPSMEIIRLDKKGKLNTENSQVKLELFKYTNDWWYDRYRLTRGHRSHNSQRFTRIWEKQVTLDNGKYTYLHDTHQNESGMYKLRVTETKSGHVAEHEFHSIVNSNYSVQSNPVFIDLELEKDNYNVGEFLDFRLPDISDAKALISMERGGEVMEMFWYDLTNSSLKIPVQEEWFPNVFLHVSIIQNYGQINNDRPMRMYTVKKILVSQANIALEPIVDTEEKIEPNKAFTIEVKEKEGQAMEYTLALVDQGLLNLTGFKTPDPQAHFSKLMALRIKTWDIFQQLIFYMNPSYAGVFSIGGDEAAEKLLDESADFNRFVPVVFHLGSFQLSANRKNKHKIHIPNYIGSLRLMVIACNDRSFGSTEKSIKVVSPLMVQSQLPRTLNITDKVDVPITFFKDEASIKQVKLTAKTSNDLIKFQVPSLTSSMADSDQSLETLSFTTGQESGNTDISFQANASGFKAFEETKLFINYPNSYSDKQEIFQIAGEEEIKIPIECFGFEKTRHVDLQISGALVPNFTKHYHDLIQYPYGCLEQTTSKAIAMIFIDDLMAMTAEEKIKNRNYLDVAALKIKSFQQNDGRFNYWQNGYYHHWSDLYAGHFLIEARDKNLLLKSDALPNWISHKSKAANQWQISGVADQYLVDREEVLQAYRLFLLAKAGKPAKSAMNRFRKRNPGPSLAKAFLAGAYHYTGMNELGQDLLNTALRQGETDKIYGHSFGSPIRNKAIVVYIMSLFNQKGALDNYYADWVAEVNQSPWLSTQDQGFTLMACAAYFGEKQNISAAVDFELNSKKIQKRIKIPSNEQERFQWSWEDISDLATLKNHGSSDLFVYKIERAISEELYQAADSKGLKLTVNYLKINGELLDLENVKQGEEVFISIQIRNTDILDQENLALTLKVPSGWELLNPRMYTTNEDSGAKYIYQDFRDDKVYTFFDLSKNKSKSFEFRAKANLTGDYYLPAVRCENMYKGNIYAMNQASRVIIK